MKELFNIDLFSSNIADRQKKIKLDEMFLSRKTFFVLKLTDTVFWLIYFLLMVRRIDIKFIIYDNDVVTEKDIKNTMYKSKHLGEKKLISFSELIIERNIYSGRHNYALNVAYEIAKNSVLTHLPLQDFLYNTKITKMDYIFIDDTATESDFIVLNKFSYLDKFKNIDSENPLQNMYKGLMLSYAFLCSRDVFPKTRKDIHRMCNSIEFNEMFKDIKTYKENEDAIQNLIVRKMGY